MANGSYGGGYAIRKRGYITFEHAATALYGDEVADGDNEATRETLDRLVHLGALRRGLILSCERCRWQQFYRAEIVGGQFTCGACGYANGLTRNRWDRTSTEPQWFYELDQVIRTLLEKHGDIPLLAASHLASKSRSTLWAPELVVAQGRRSKELDICVITDGRVVIGEAKSNGRLDGERSRDEEARRLVEAAQLFGAEQIVLATSKQAWVDGTKAAVESVAALTWRQGREPMVVELTNL
jgi:hypothetical protein